MEGMPKLSIVFVSADMEKLHAGALMGGVAAGSGMEVNFFVTMEALRMFLKETVDKQDFKVSGIGETILEKKVDLFYKMLEDAKEVGEVKVYACSLVCDIMDWEKEHMLDIVDDIIGVSAFFRVSEGAQIMML